MKQKPKVIVAIIISTLFAVLLFGGLFMYVFYEFEELKSILQKYGKQDEKDPQIIERVVETERYVYLKRDDVNKVIGLLDAQGKMKLVYKFFDNWIRDFITRECGNCKQRPETTREITLTIISIARQKNIPVILAFSLAAWESGFNPGCVSRNHTSKDIGLFQLNTKTFSHISEKKLYSIKTNTLLGLTHFRKMYNESGSWRKAVIKYNAGNLKKIYGTSINHFDNVFEIEDEITAKFCETFGDIL